MKMKSVLNRIVWPFIFGIILMAGCAVPQHYWPQKDIVKSDVSTIPGQRTVLIASRASAYKKQLVSELQKQLSAAHIPHTTIGVKQLAKVDPNDYGAVVVINTCLAWGLDHEVSAFLESQKTNSNIILLTTSGEGSWLPNKRGRDFDAISGASIEANVSDVARNLLERIQKRLAPATPRVEKQG
jgi:hypothetical protein